jgi:hypothetical protein
MSPPFSGLKSKSKNISMEKKVIYSSEISVNFNGLHGVIFQNIEFFVSRNA